jgi:hypothetical protein
MRYILPLFLWVGLLACNLENRQVKGAKEAAEKYRSLQVKRITDAQITAIVEEWGPKVANKAEAALTEALSKAPKNTAQICELKNIKAIADLAKMYGVKINLLSAKDSASIALDSKEHQLLAAYLYNAQQKLPQNDNIQKIGDSMLVYNAPIATDHLICKACFGTNKIPLALWRVQFMKREVVRKVDAKSLKNL